ncbi:hypothetical protein [Aquabacterium sp.]|uniref:hypothetical protein n=1 Tax=Aquabacterium sp. TaxID=1872578 RepID=UPI0019BC5E54|nr:hypothetical protein [Aquabacterium sp.]MBC7698949.1 hypothetical protein [Aquabacterium sp.]
MAAGFAGVLQKEVAISRVVSIVNSPALSITSLVRRNIDASNPVHQWNANRTHSGVSAGHAYA